MTTDAAEPTTVTAIFIGGPASGARREISKSQNSVDVPIRMPVDYVDPLRTANQTATDTVNVVTYQRWSVGLDDDTAIIFFAPVGWSDVQAFKYLLYSFADATADRASRRRHERGSRCGNCVSWEPKPGQKWEGICTEPDSKHSDTEFCQSCEFWKSRQQGDEK